MKTVNRKVGYLILIVGLVACSAKSVKNSEEKDTDSVSIEVPSFDTDSAYAYIERQVQFGFRVPNTPAHLATADYLSSEYAHLQRRIFFKHTFNKPYSPRSLSCCRNFRTFPRRPCFR